MGVAMCRLSAVLLIGVAACESSSAPVDQEAQALAESYCEACCIPPDQGGECQNSQAGCTQIVLQTIVAVCQDENTAYYQCLLDNDCDSDACTAQWNARQTCIFGGDAGIGGSGGDGG